MAKRDEGEGGGGGGRDKKTNNKKKKNKRNPQVLQTKNNRNKTIWTKCDLT